MLKVGIVILVISISAIISSIKRKDGVIIHLDENDKIESLNYDKESTEKSKKRIKTKLKRLLSGKHLDVNKA